MFSVILFIYLNFYHFDMLFMQTDCFKGINLIFFLFV